MVCVDHVLKDPVLPVRAWNRSGMSEGKNCTLVCHPPGTYGGSSFPGAGSGADGHVKTSERCDGSGGVGGAVLGRSEVVDMKASF